MSTVRWVSNQVHEEIVSSANKSKLAIGVKVDDLKENVVLYLGNITVASVPVGLFKPSGSGPNIVEPNFDDVEIIDYGQTVRLGEYEAAVDVMLDSTRK